MIFLALTPLLFAIVSKIENRAITIWRPIQKRSHEPIDKPNTKNKAKGLRATPFAIAKLEEKITDLGAILLPIIRLIKEVSLIDKEISPCYLYTLYKRDSTLEEH